MLPVMAAIVSLSPPIIAVLIRNKTIDHGLVIILLLPQILILPQ